MFSGYLVAASYLFWMAVIPRHEIAENVSVRDVSDIPEKEITFLQLIREADSLNLNKNQNESFI